MLPGPVFNVELLTTARRGRYYALRAIYGLVLLGIVAASYRDFDQMVEQQLEWARMAANRGLPVPSLREQYTQIMAQFANQTVTSLVVVQYLAVLALTPAMVAGVIASEKQRKTLHYLLASRLTGPEIVVGKLMARLLHVGVYLAIGLPVLSLLTLFGGVDPMFVLLAYAAAISTAVFLASLSIFVSAIARRAREAIFLAYVLEAFWLFLPPINAEIPREQSPIIHDWLGPINHLVLYSNPFSLIELRTDQPRRQGPLATATADLATRTGLLVLSQSILAAALVAIAVRRLRPTFAREGGGRITFWTLPRRIRFFARPGVGDAAMLWKEKYATPPGKLARLLGIPIAVVCCAIIAVIGFEYVRPAFAELREYGRAVPERLMLNFQGGMDHFRLRENLTDYIRGVMLPLYAFWMLGVAGAAAGAFTGEHEEDTWISLVSTTLTGREIVLSKMVGAAWRFRGLAIFMVLLWVIGVAAGALHPIALVAGIVELAVFSWFFIALGVYCSLTSRSTTRSLAWTVAGLVLFSGGYLAVATPLGLPTESPFLALGSAFMILGWSLVSPCNVHFVDMRSEDFYILNGNSGFREIDIFNSSILLYASHHAGAMIATCVLGVLLFGAGAALLTAASLRRFETVVDRPRRPALSDADAARAAVRKPKARAGAKGAPGGTA
jgi:ABC-type transport system involved in multi-copper enzyme maturation permease subunit